MMMMLMMKLHAAFRYGHQSRTLRTVTIRCRKKRTIKYCSHRHRNKTL